MAALLAVICKSGRIGCDGSIEQSHFMKLITVLVFAVFVSATSAYAHSPYFGQRETVDLPEFGEVEFAILFGDGIVFADPSQVIVFDSEGHLLAATPLSDGLIIRCSGSNDGEACSAYDAVRGLVYQPDFDQWGRGRTIVEDGRPSGDAYPEHMDISYGFFQRPATFPEKISFEFAGIAHAPGSTLFAIFWWSLALASLARLFWRWRGNDWKIKPVRLSGVVVAFLSVTAFLAMAFLAVLSLLYVPYLFLFFLFVFTLGGTVAFVVTRPRYKRAVNRSA